MAEVNVPTTLITPAGNLTFNDTSSGTYLWLTSRDGGDGGDLRTNIQPIPQFDGSYIHNAYESGVVETYTGQLVGATFTARRALEDDMRLKLKSLLRADGTIQWTPSGTTARQRTVRLCERLTIRGGIIKEFQFQLCAADPLAYSTALQSQQSAFIGTGSSPATNSYKEITVTNGGQAASWPVLRLQGPFNSPAFYNMTTGKYVYCIASTASALDYLDVDMFRQTIVFSNGLNALSTLNANQSEFWQLLPGANTIRFQNVFGGGNTTSSRGTAFWRDAFYG